MGQSRQPVTGGRKRYPATHLNIHRQRLPVVPLPSDVPCDPIRVFVALLEAGFAPQEVWPACSSGFEALLNSAPKKAPILQGDQSPPQVLSDNYPEHLQRLQEIMRRQWTADSAAPRTAIRAHRQLSGLIYAAQLCISTPGWFLDPSTAVFVCATQGEAAEIEALLRRDDELERGEDLLETAKDLAEGLMAPSPGWRYSGPPPVVLASEIPSGAAWREVFLSPGCCGLKGGELLRVLASAKVGVHLLAAGAGA